MRRAILSAVLAFALMITLGTTAIHPAKAYISTYDWKGQYHIYDPYWSWSGVEVFEEGTNATLVIQLYNDGWYDNYDDYYNGPHNISAVKVYMDWGVNYSSTQVSETNPFSLGMYEFRTFSITFTMPPVSVASNLYLHGWTIYVEHVNATGDKLGLWYSMSGSNLIVYSSTQKQAMMLYDEIYTWFNMMSWSWDSVEARNLYYEAYAEWQLAITRHRSGLFDDALTSYTTILSMLDQALSTEQAYDLDWQDHQDNHSQQMDDLNIAMSEAMIAGYEADAEARLIEANASMKTAEAEMIKADAQLAIAQAAMTQAYAWIVFGIGFIVFGIAAVVWASKRPSSPP